MSDFALANPLASLRAGDVLPEPGDGGAVFVWLPRLKALLESDLRRREAS